MNFSNYCTSLKEVRNSAAIMADKIIDDLISRGGEGFSRPKTGKRMHAKAIRPTPIEHLLYISNPQENPLPVRERSRRGKRKAKSIAMSNADMKDYQERLFAYRKEPGINRLAKKLPFPSWPDIDGIPASS